MSTSVQFLLSKLPGLIQIADNLIGDHIPDTIVDDGAKLYQYVLDTIANLKQNAPLTADEDKQLDALVEQVTSRDYWQSKD